jgi:hypothetical protein
LQMGDERLLQIGLFAEERLWQSGKLEHIRVPKIIGGCLFIGGFVGAAQEFLLVGAQPSTLEKQGFDLPLEFPF